MRALELDDLTVGEIMSRWPCTIGVFLGFNLHCVGCPISGFHTLMDAALEHGVSPQALAEAVQRTASALSATDIRR